jgi:hypothetical protein
MLLLIVNRWSAGIDEPARKLFREPPSFLDERQAHSLNVPNTWLIEDLPTRLVDHGTPRDLP